MLIFFDELMKGIRVAHLFDELTYLGGDNDDIYLPLLKTTTTMNNYTFSFEKLNVWKLARNFTVQIYQLTSKYPLEEKFGMTSQIRRAVCSITNNIAEGNARISGKEQARFTEISYSSLNEVLNQLIVSSDLGFIETEKVDELRPLIIEIGNKLNALRKAQLRKD